ncbi:MAG TPA: hypothetical protein VGF86_09250 [Candidatus Tumulicola sp.]|jgi:hypothetical protein
MALPAHLNFEDAALYALGAMDEPERRAADRHAAGCDACSRLLGQAEDDVTVLAAAEPLASPAPMQPAFSRRSPRLRFATALALAAALVLALLPSAFFWQQNRAMHAAMQADAEAVGRLGVPASFRTADFRGLGPGTTARVMYAPDGSWYVVLVRGASRALQVAWMHGTDRTMLGAAEPRGQLAMLYLPKSHRMDRLALMDGGRVVAEAQLAY